METTKERAARCDRATHARRSSSLPAYGSRTASITRRRRRAKRKALRAATLAAAVLLLGGISVAIFTTPTGSKQETNILPPTTTVGAYIPDTTAPAAETVEPTEPAVRYPLTDAERDVVERVVMAEAGGESFEGQMLVAQCILNAAEKRGVDPSEAVVLYSYTKSRPDPTQRVKDAVAAVFDRGETVVDEPILYFYNPALVTSDFHESQIFVIEEGGHRFFAERSNLHQGRHVRRVRADHRYGGRRHADQGPRQHSGQFPGRLHASGLDLQQRQRREPDVGGHHTEGPHRPEALFHQPDQDGRSVGRQGQGQAAPRLRYGDLLHPVDRR